MSSNATRQTLAHGVVVCGMIFAAFSFIIAPLESERASSQRQLNALQLKEASSARRLLEAESQDSIQQRASEYAQAIRDRSDTAGDELALHRIYHELAAKWEINIDRFDPSPLKLSTSRSKKDKNLLKPDFAATVSIDATGTLDHAVAMLDELTRTAGFVSVRSMKISPLTNTSEMLVRIRLECDHYSFEIPDEAATAVARDGRN